MLCKKYGWDVLASAGTLRGMEAAGAFASGARAAVIPPSGVAVGSLWVKPFPTPHDTAESNGYTVTLPDGRRVAVATDIGHITPQITAALRGCDAVLIESNHDVQMLQSGPYPYYLKQRILSDRGHLSNAACDAVLPSLVEEGSVYLMLGHLSAENNRPILAYEGAVKALAAAGIRVGTDCRVKVAPRDAEAPILWL